MADPCTLLTHSHRCFNLMLVPFITMRKATKDDAYSRAVQLNKSLYDPVASTIQPVVRFPRMPIIMLRCTGEESVHAWCVCVCVCVCVCQYRLTYGGGQGIVLQIGPRCPFKKTHLQLFVRASSRPASPDATS